VLPHDVYRQQAAPALSTTPSARQRLACRQRLLACHVPCCLSPVPRAGAPPAPPVGGPEQPRPSSRPRKASPSHSSPGHASPPDGSSLVRVRPCDHPLPPPSQAASPCDRAVPSRLSRARAGSARLSVVKAYSLSNSVTFTTPRKRPSASVRRRRGGQEGDAVLPRVCQAYRRRGQPP
jgi:hypothetical protein